MSHAPPKQRLGRAAASATIGLILMMGCTPAGPTPVDLHLSFSGPAATYLVGDAPHTLYTRGRAPTVLIRPALPVAEGHCNPFYTGQVQLSLTPPGDGSALLIDVFRGQSPPWVHSFPGGVRVDTAAWAQAQGVDDFMQEVGLWTLLTTWSCGAEGAPTRRSAHTVEIRRPSRESPGYTTTREAMQSAVERPDTALRKEALALVEPLDDKLTPTIILGAAARRLRTEGRFDDAMTVARAAAEHARARGVVSEEARMMSLAHEIARDQGDLHNALALIDGALAIDRQWGLDARFPSDHLGRAYVLEKLSRRLEALEAVGQSDQAALAAGQAAKQLEAQAMELELLQLLGHHHLVWQRLNALPGADDVADPILANNLGWVMLLTAETSMAPGARRDATLGRATALFERSLAAFAQTGQPHWSLNVYLNIAWAALLKGDVPSAQAAYEGALSLPAPTDVEYRRFMQRIQARLALAAGHPQGAIRHSQAMESAARADDAWLDAGRAAFDQGEALLAADDRAGAIAAFDRALAYSEQLTDLRSPLHRATLLASRAPWEERAVSLRLQAGRNLEALTITEVGARERRRALAPTPGEAAWADETLALEKTRASLSRMPQTEATQAELARVEAALQRTWALRAAVALPEKGTAPLSQEDIMARVPDGAVWMKPVSMPSELVIWESDGERLGVRQAPILRQTLETDLIAFANGCEAGTPNQTLGARLAAALLGPHADAPPKALILVTEGMMRQLPWGCLPTAEGPLATTTLLRHTLGPLGEASPTQPSARRPLIITNPQGDLPQAEREGEWLKASRLKNATVLRGRDVTRNSVVEALTQADLIHYAGHGVGDRDRPWMSHLGLARGERLSLMDVQGLTLPGSLVFLNACDVGQVGHDGGALGLADGLLSAGARAVIASRWAVPDREGAQVSRSFYAHLNADGSNPAEALSLALRAADGEGMSSSVWGAYLILEAPVAKR